MFKTGDYIVYGNSGVCLVERIGPLQSAVVPKDRIYYTLRPYYLDGSTIFTPADNKKVKMRSVISKEDAKRLIDGAKDIEILWIADEKKREACYKEALGTCDCREMIRIIKTIYLRKKSRQQEGKKITATDEKYFHLAEERLYGELAISLKMEKNDVKEYMVEQVRQRESEIEEKLQ